MRILRICQEVPFPPDDGVRSEPFHSTRLLALRGHEITLVCFQRGERDVSPLREWCDLHVVPFDRRNTPLDFALGVFRRQPVNYMKYRDARAGALISELLSRRRYEVAIVDYSALGWYAHQIKQTSRIPVVTRWPNVDTLIWERWTNSQTNRIRRQLGEVQSGFVREFERKLARASDLCVPMGTQDADLLQRLEPSARISLVPLAVDVGRYESISSPAEESSILFLASDYAWHPNYDAARWLCEEIMPRIWQRCPQARVRLTGRHVPKALRPLRDGSRIEFSGFVDDERDVIGKSTVVVIPMRLGGGVKLKMLTAFASSRAVVSTAKGCEGVTGLVDGNHLLVRDDPDEFAQAVVELIQNEALRQKLERAGHDYVLSRYDWNVVIEMWEQVLQRAVGSSLEPVMCGDAI